MIGRIWVLLKVYFWNSLRNMFALIFKTCTAIGVIFGFTLFIVLMHLSSSVDIQPIALSQNWSTYIQLTSGDSSQSAQPLSLLSYYLSMYSYPLLDEFNCIQSNSA